ncbi:Hypothetical protein PHPALM_37704 [Phytophthora palmivora]|uniref:PiggyBac transposable element-derived protein domain-containing protein n=1 Tax=Phytophthora palmivora TaxID=4796 RepID=A0A2P4WWR5_9STRA|nr:Hypothetical protein PHPALM_37704 [Phytophthora palmivora]
MGASTCTTSYVFNDREFLIVYGAFYRYSLQLCIKYKKYNKGLFLGLIDLAVINSYIIFNAARSASSLPKLSHVKVLKRLHIELCQLRDEDWRPSALTRAFKPRHPRSKTQVDPVVLTTSRF